MSKFNKLNLQILSMGSAALIVSAGAMAGAPTRPVTTLSAHTVSGGAGVAGLSYAIDGTVSFTGTELSGLGTQHTAMCSQAGFTCTLLDGSGDGMMQYIVKDSNGKSHVELVVGSLDGNGLFLSDTFVRYSGGTSLDSMANKLIIKDTTEIAAADTGFRLAAEWHRGDYQTGQPMAFQNANTSGGTGIDLDSIVDMNIGHVQTFHMDGLVSENGVVTTPGAGAGGEQQAGANIDIQMGTTAANTAVAAEDIQAMGVFHTKLQGGVGSDTTINYNPGASSITLGGSSIAFTATDGVSSTFIHQAGFGFNRDESVAYSTGVEPADVPGLRDFAYLKIAKVSATGGVPGGAIGTYLDPMGGVQAATGTITDTSQNTGAGVAIASMYEATQTGANTTVHPADFVHTEVGVGNGDPFGATSAGGTFTTANVTSLTGAWTTVFGTAP